MRRRRWPPPSASCARAGAVRLVLSPVPNSRPERGPVLPAQEVTLDQTNQRRRAPESCSRSPAMSVTRRRPATTARESLRAAAPLMVRRRHDADTLTLALCGELDLATADVLKRELDDAAHTNAAVIKLDLRKLEFIDSSGLHVIFKAHRRSDPQLLILNGPARVQRAFELCGLEELLTFVDEIPIHTPAKSDISSVPDDTANRSSVTLRAAIARRAQQGALAAAVRQLRSHGGLRAIR